MIFDQCFTSYIFFKRVLVFAFLLFFAGCQFFTDHSKFIAVAPTESGIDFANTLVYNDSLTVLEFEYMYNGGGVALCDINNDGLTDIFFTGNMVSNKLYLNLGDWKFENITKSAKLESNGWSNGVAIIDINQDGYKDIYVSRGGPRGTPKKDRANLLYINNGDNTFNEAAATYGLDDTSYTVQAAFFDYDKDGDLDVYLLSNALVDFNRNTSRPKNNNGKAPSADKLYENTGRNEFIDVSNKANILIEGFGLGVEICDINNDNWPDIYVSNDFLTDDLIYINQKDGSFENQAFKYLKHQTYNGMGNDVADYNNDGLVDIVVLDMLPKDNKRRKLTMMGNNYDEFQNGLSYGYQPQYVRNTLQLNNGNGTFSEIGQLAGIDATDWSWSALFADYDNDGWKDLLITNGYRQDITNLDFMVYGQQALAMGTAEANKKERLKALNELEGIKLNNFIYKNQRNLEFSDETKSWGLTAPTFSNGAAYGDLDNDGDLDLVINNIDEKASIYRNTTIAKDSPVEHHFLRIKLKGPKGNRDGLGATVVLKHNNMIQHQYYSPFRGYLSTVESYLQFGLGVTTMVDSVIVIWPDGAQAILKDVVADQVLEVDYSDAIIDSAIADDPGSKYFIPNNKIRYKHQENAFVDFKLQPLLPHMHSKNGPGIAVGDINNDRLEDFYVGGASGYTGGLFIQQPDGQFNVSKLPGDSLKENMGVLLFDADNDGDLDFYLASGGSTHPKGSPLYQDQLLLNDGDGNFRQTKDVLPGVAESNASVAAGDYDGDGDLDILVAGRVSPGEYPMPANSYLLRNDTKDGQCRFTDVTAQLLPELKEVGMVTSVLWTDINNDGLKDILMVGEFMPITVYKNLGNGFEKLSSSAGLANTSGWWNSLVSGDFDNDGDIDYIAGNLGLNTRFKVSPKEPLCIYANDFDKNGRIDPVMCYFVEGTNYLAHSRDDLIAQINAMRGRFRTYNAYASSTFDRSFLPEEIENAYIVKAEIFESCYIENEGNEKFKITRLPVQAQFSPIYGMVAKDINADGNLDLITVGNSYATEVSLGRYDASIGNVFFGDGKGNFETVNPKESGLVVNGDAKGLVTLSAADGDQLLLAANNSDSLTSYSFKVGRTFKADLADDYAIMTLRNGRKVRHEFYYGNTYLSHSERSVVIPENILTLEVIDIRNNKRKIKLTHD